MTLSTCDTGSDRLRHGLVSTFPIKAIASLSSRMDKFKGPLKQVEGLRSVLGLDAVMKLLPIASFPSETLEQCRASEGTAK